jgi:hypothetical protein
LFHADFGGCFICFCDLRRRQGVASKRVGSFYRSGKSRNWLKDHQPGFRQDVINASRYSYGHSEGGKWTLAG